MNKLIIGLLAAGGLYWLLKPKGVAADFQDPGYMIDNPENREIVHSTDDFGGVQLDEIQPAIGTGVSRNRKNDSENISANYPYYTGGTWLHPEFLPPVRTARIQGGRFIHPEFLPDTREYKLQRCYTSR